MCKLQASHSTAPHRPCCCHQGTMLRATLMEPSVLRVYYCPQVQIQVQSYICEVILMQTCADQLLTGNNVRNQQPMHRINTETNRERTKKLCMHIFNSISPLRCLWSGPSKEVSAVLAAQYISKGVPSFGQNPPSSSRIPTTIYLSP